MNAITDLQGAIPALKSQIDALKTSTTGTTTTSGTSTVTENITTINNTVAGGPVNNQSGNVVYLTQQSDNGALIIMADASPVAVTLNNSVTTPWYAFITNQGAGVVTLTPQQNTIDGNASQTLLQGYFLTLFFDGTQFWSGTIPIVPVTFNAIAHQFLTAYNAATGMFSSAQPAFTGISGVATTAQIGTGTPAAGKYVDGAAGVWTALPTVPATIAPVAGEYLTGYNSGTGTFSISATPGISATITTAALTVGGTQGSMTYIGGVLTAQIQAT